MAFHLSPETKWHVLSIYDSLTCKYNDLHVFIHWLTMGSMTISLGLLEFATRLSSRVDINENHLKIWIIPPLGIDGNILMQWWCHGNTYAHPPPMTIAPHVIMPLLFLSISMPLITLSPPLTSMEKGNFSLGLLPLSTLSFGILLLSTSLIYFYFTFLYMVIPRVNPWHTWK
jgi:hypothetical protein